MSTMRNAKSGPHARVPALILAAAQAPVSPSPLPEASRGTCDAWSPCPPHHRPHGPPDRYAPASTTSFAPATTHQNARAHHLFPPPSLRANLLANQQPASASRAACPPSRTSPPCRSSRPRPRPPLSGCSRTRRRSTASTSRRSSSSSRTSRTSRPAATKRTTCGGGARLLMRGTLLASRGGDKPAAWWR